MPPTAPPWSGPSPCTRWEVDRVVNVVFEFWGVLQRLAGATERSLELPGPATVQSALEALGQALPALAAQLESTAVADGDRLLLRQEPLRDGQRLALLPPVAGG